MDTRRARRPFKVDLTLRPEDRADYEALLADPRATGGDALAWLAGRGYAVTRAAVYRHRRHVLRGLDDVRHWAGVARHSADAARAHGPAVLADGAVTELEHLLMRALHAINASGQTPDPRQFADLATAVARAVATRGAIDLHRQAAEERARELARSGRKATGAEVVRRVRYILGMGPKPGDADYDPEEVASWDH
jgi:hypothetical protein